MNHLKIILIIFLLSYSTSVSSETIVYIDINKILKFSKAGVNASKEMEKKLKNSNKKLNELQKAIKEDEAKIISQKNILSKEDYEKKINELKAKINKIRQLRSNEINDFKKNKQILTQNFMNKINPIVADYAAENSISIVIIKKNILLGKKELDITDKILLLVDKEISIIKIN